MSATTTSPGSAPPATTTATSPRSSVMSLSTCSRTTSTSSRGRLSTSPKSRPACRRPPEGTSDDMRVRELWLYPVKSLKGERLSEVEVTEEGLLGDRLVHVRNRSGRVITSRTKPRLLALQGTLGPDGQALIDGRPWQAEESRAAVRAAAGRHRRRDSRSRRRSAALSSQRPHRRRGGARRAQLAWFPAANRRGACRRRAAEATLRDDHLRPRHPGAGSLSPAPDRQRLPRGACPRLRSRRARAHQRRGSGRARALSCRLSPSLPTDNQTKRNRDHEQDSERIDIPRLSGIARRRPVVGASDGRNTLTSPLQDAVTRPGRRARSSAIVGGTSS